MRVLQCLTLVGLAAFGWCATDILLVANGKLVPCDPPPLMHEGHVYVPLRAAAEAVGGEVEYDSAAKRVTICRATTCTLVQQSDGITLEGHLLVGIRQVAEALDARVDWDGPRHTVRITTSD